MDDEHASKIIEAYVERVPPVHFEDIAKGLEAKLVAHHLCGDFAEARRCAEMLVLIRSLM